MSARFSVSSHDVNSRVATIFSAYYMLFHDVHEMNACRGGHVFVRMIQVENAGRIWIKFGMLYLYGLPKILSISCNL
jgi:hypothetical protein